jgi:cellulose synthase/poly-beta-1,6-N-acetylglucosamine synthase-like glycosyltransferase
MVSLLNAVFWISAGCLAYIYAGYPLFLWSIGAFRRVRFRRDYDHLPGISVLISARNEEKDIAWKVAETLAWDYPRDRLEVLVASDASEDRTEEILRSIPDSRLRWIANRRRLGKNLSLNKLCALASGELLFFTDANSHIPRNSLHSITRYFADCRVGCVTSCERPECAAGDGGMSHGGGLYQRYESWLNSLEHRIGSVLTCDGSIFCIRRDLFTPLDPDLANDLELPIRIGALGYATLYEASACSIERATTSAREEFRRRRRICAQGFLGAWRLRGVLRGVRAWQFVSRKLLRWFALIPIVLVTVSCICLAGRSRFYEALLVPQLCFYGFALAGWWSNEFRRRTSSLTSIPFFFLLVHGAALLGILQTCWGRRFSLWESAALTRGPAAVADPEDSSPVSEGPGGPADAEFGR